MKCTNFFYLRQAIGAVSMRELRKAVEFCGGEYSWGDDIEKPVVIANTDWCGPIDVVILKVFLDEHDNLRFEGAVQETGEPLDCLEFSDIEETHLQYIIEYMKMDGDVNVVNMESYLDEVVKSIKDLVNYDEGI